MTAKRRKRGRKRSGISSVPATSRSCLPVSGTSIMSLWQFRALLGGCFLCRCALSEKIRLRHLDVSKCEDKAAAQRAKDAAAIPDAVGIDERLLTEQVRERLLRGESIEDLIRSEGDAL